MKSFRQHRSSGAPPLIGLGLFVHSLGWLINARIIAASAEAHQEKLFITPSSPAARLAANSRLLLGESEFAAFFFTGLIAIALLASRPFCRRPALAWLRAAPVPSLLGLAFRFSLKTRESL